MTREAVHSPAYTCSQLNPSTYLIIHNDKYEEYPYIYVKIYPSPLDLIVVIDTGCGAANTQGNATPNDLKNHIKQTLLDTQITSIEHRKEPHHEYIVICTHCHFDHIGGIQPFADASNPIIASGHDKSFLSPSNLPENSLCTKFGLPTPSYKIARFTKRGETLIHVFDFPDGTGRHGAKLDLGLTALHTPGHTPDSLAIYDRQESWLYIGDTAYHRKAEMPWGAMQDVPIVFPPQGNWRDFRASLKFLICFVEHEQQRYSNTNGHIIRLAAGHTTSAALAAPMLKTVLRFFDAIIAGKVPVAGEMPGDHVVPSGSLGPDAFTLWQDNEKWPDFSLIAPSRFLDEYRGEE